MPQPYQVAQPYRRPERAANSVQAWAVYPKIEPLRRVGLEIRVLVITFGRMNSPTQPVRFVRPVEKRRRIPVAMILALSFGTLVFLSVGGVLALSVAANCPQHLRPARHAVEPADRRNGGFAARRI